MTKEDLTILIKLKEKAVSQKHYDLAATLRKAQEQMPLDSENKQTYIILWSGPSLHEYDTHEGTVASAIEYVKAERRWHNYGRNKAEIIEAKLLFSIEESVKEVNY